MIALGGWMDQAHSLLSPGMLLRGGFCCVGVGEKEGIAALSSWVGWHQQRYGMEEHRDHGIIQPPGRASAGIFCAL